MDISQIIKSGAGSIDGLGKSKKYALTVAFTSVCMYGAASGADVLERIASLAAGVVVVSTYIIFQAKTEAQAATKTKE